MMICQLRLPSREQLELHFNPKNEMFEIKKQVKYTCEEQSKRPYDKGFF
jgi:hypothetical protein